MGKKEYYLLKFNNAVYLSKNKVLVCLHVNNFLLFNKFKKNLNAFAINLSKKISINNFKNANQFFGVQIKRIKQNGNIFFN